MTANKMGIASSYDLDQHGLRNLNMAYWNLTTGALVERIVARREGVLAHEGAVVVRTGHHTGRSPNDKFIVCCQEDHDNIWWGKVNKPFQPEQFDRLYMLMTLLLPGSGCLRARHHRRRPPRSQPAHPGDHRRAPGTACSPATCSCACSSKNCPTTCRNSPSSRRPASMPIPRKTAPIPKSSSS